MKIVRAEFSAWISWWCPGCEEPHGIPIKPHPKGWDFSGTDEKPTLSPSVLVYDHKSMTIKGEVYSHPRCHVFIKDGQIQFLQDCTHALAGKTVEIPDWPEGVEHHG